MAKVVGRSRPRGDGVGSSMKLSETGIFIAMAIVILLGLKYYFIDYRHSPGFVLGEYVGAIKSGKVEQQYDMLDAADKKKYWPSEKEYEKGNPQARGYTERIIGSTFTKPVPDGKDSTVFMVDGTVTMRGPAGKDLIDNGQVTQVTDKYALRKDGEGNWKLVLSKSNLDNMLKQKPNPPGDSF